MQRSASEATFQSVPVLFLSGAGLPSWIWDDVIALLPKATPVHVAEYPDDEGASLAQYADAVAAQVTWPAFVVVAHSAGGVVAAELLAQHPGRVVGLVGVSAVFPGVGESFVGTMPAPKRLLLSVALRAFGTKPPAKAIRSRLANGLPDPLPERIVAEFSPESLRFYLDAVGERQLPPAAAYLVTEQDEELPVARQERSARIMGATALARASTGHMPMLEDPAAVGNVVSQVLASYGASAN